MTRVTTMTRAPAETRAPADKRPPAGVYPTAGRVAQLLGLVAVGGAVVAAILTVLAHLGSAPDMDALSLTISDYAVSNRGGPMDRAMLILGAASLAVPAGLRVVRAPVGRLPILLLLVWSAGLMAAAIIPTDPMGMELSTQGYVHRYVSVAAFVSLPVAVLVAVPRLAADPRWRAGINRLRALALTSVVGLVALYWVAYPGERVMMGLVQRMLVGVEVALLAVLAVELYRVAARYGRRPAGVVADLGATAA